MKAVIDDKSRTGFSSDWVPAILKAYGSSIHVPFVIIAGMAGTVFIVSLIQSWDRLHKKTTSDVETNAASNAKGQW